jgi:chromosome segregation ATPase
MILAQTSTTISSPTSANLVVWLAVLVAFAKRQMWLSKHSKSCETVFAQPMVGHLSSVAQPSMTRRKKIDQQGSKTLSEQLDLDNDMFSDSNKIGTIKALNTSVSSKSSRQLALEQENTAMEAQLSSYEDVAAKNMKLRDQQAQLHHLQQQNSQLQTEVQALEELQQENRKLQAAAAEVQRLQRKNEDMAEVVQLLQSAKDSNAKLCETATQVLQRWTCQLAAVGRPLTPCCHR